MQKIKHIALTGELVRDVSQTDPAMGGTMRSGRLAPMSDQAESGDFHSYSCMYCGYIYDEEAGDPDNGIAPGTRWEDIPEDWCC